MRLTTVAQTVTQKGLIGSLDKRGIVHSSTGGATVIDADVARLLEAGAGLLVERVDALPRYRALRPFGGKVIDSNAELERFLDVVEGVVL